MIFFFIFYTRFLRFFVGRNQCGIRDIFFVDIMIATFVNLLTIYFFFVLNAGGGEC